MQIGVYMLPILGSLAAKLWQIQRRVLKTFAIKNYCHKKKIHLDFEKQFNRPTGQNTNANRCIYASYIRFFSSKVMADPAQGIV